MNSMYSLTNKLIAVTGTNRGLGKVLIQRLIEHPDQPRILLTSRNEQYGKESFEELTKKYSLNSERIIYHQLDINSEKSIQNFSAYLKENAFKIDILVNNAGVTDRRDWDMDWCMPKETVLDIMNTNFFSTVNFTEAMLSHLNEEAKILMISSNLAQLSWQSDKMKQFLSEKMSEKELLSEAETFTKYASEPNNKHKDMGYCKYVYHTSKAFLNAYTRFVLIDKLKENQTCVNIHPGWLKTRMGGFDEAPKPAEDGVICTMKIINYSLQDCKNINGEFLDEDGTKLEY